MTVRPTSTTRGVINDSHEPRATTSLSRCARPATALWTALRASPASLSPCVDHPASSEPIRRLRQRHRDPNPTIGERSLWSHFRRVVSRRHVQLKVFDLGGRWQSRAGRQHEAGTVLALRPAPRGQHFWSSAAGRHCARRARGPSQLTVRPGSPVVPRDNVAAWAPMTLHRIAAVWQCAHQGLPAECV